MPDAWFKLPLFSFLKRWRSLMMPQRYHVLYFQHSQPIGLDCKSSFLLYHAKEKQTPPHATTIYGGTFTCRCKKWSTSCVRCVESKSPLCSLQVFEDNGWLQSLFETCHLSVSCCFSPRLHHSSLYLTSFLVLAGERGSDFISLPRPPCVWWEMHLALPSPQASLACRRKKTRTTQHWSFFTIHTYSQHSVHIHNFITKNINS